MRVLTPNHISNLDILNKKQALVTSKFNKGKNQETAQALFCPTRFVQSIHLEGEPSRTSFQKVLPVLVYSGTQ